VPFPDIVESIRPSVVGMGLLVDPRDPLSVVILGTGFLAETGEVVGVVFATRVKPHEVPLPGSKGPRKVATIPLPTGFGYAVPINRLREEPRARHRLPPVIHE